MILKSINPYNGELIAQYEEFSDQKAEAIIEDAEKSFRSWKHISFQEKAVLMRQAAELLQAKKDKYAQTMTLEMGKPITESRAEVEKCAWVCKYYAEHAEAFLAPEVIETDALLSRVNYEPLGCILGIMPWNFPFWQVFRFLTPTLMAGNTALLKHASNVQGCALHIQDIFSEAGFPKGVFSALVMGSRKVEEVIENSKIKAVTLTGSENAGSHVAARAGRLIKKSMLELGGSNAFIILDDADIDNSVEIAVNARFQNCGQSCIAAKRFMIQQKIAKIFTDKFKAAVAKLKVGDPLNENTRLGPLANMAQAMELEGQVNRSIEMGAIPSWEPKRSDAIYYPVVLENVKPEMPVMQEELFGPVAPIVVFKDIEEAIKMTNSSKFGLGVTLCTRNREKAEKLIPEFEDGAVFVNSLVKSDPRLPFGGTKKSGYGRELSLHGIREFVNVKTVYFAK